TQNFNEQTEIQLHVENLASGTYLLHLQTNEGMAVKKLVKK
ncbi:Por secretion system C-terminal sorting domain-containing protein, partial [Paenimyroides aquimaris]